MLNRHHCQGRYSNRTLGSPLAKPGLNPFDVRADIPTWKLCTRSLWAVLIPLMSGQVFRPQRTAFMAMNAVLIPLMSGQVFRRPGKRTVTSPTRLNPFDVRAGIPTDDGSVVLAPLPVLIPLMSGQVFRPSPVTGGSASASLNPFDVRAGIPTSRPLKPSRLSCLNPFDVRAGIPTMSTVVTHGPTGVLIPLMSGQVFRLLPLKKPFESIGCRGCSQDFSTLPSGWSGGCAV